MIFGTFLSGPLAGSTFSLSEGSNSDGSAFIGLIFSLLALTGIYMCIVTPFAIWPLFFSAYSKDIGTGPTIGMCVVMLIYTFYRYYSDVRHWNVSIIKEIIFGIIFYSIILVGIFFVILLYYDIKYQLALDWNGLFQDMKHNYGIGELFGLLFISGFMSVIPSFIIKFSATRTMKSIMKIHVRR